MYMCVQGAVKVQAPCLSRAVDTKTYVVTNKTTAQDLVAIVLGGYRALYHEQDLFYLGLERISKRHCAGWWAIPVGDNTAPANKRHCAGWWTIPVGDNTATGKLSL